MCPGTEMIGSVLEQHEFIPDYSAEFCTNKDVL